MAWLLPAISLGLTAFGLFAQGRGQQQANLNEARKAELAMRVGQVQVDQIDAAYREELDTTIRNIRAIAASSGQPVDSQAIQAFIRGEEQASDRQRRTAVANARLQSNTSGLDAVAYRRAARWSLIGGIAGGLSSLAEIGGLRQPPPT